MELNVERVTRLLQEILETSKSQAGELKLQVSQGDVMEYIRQTALCIEPLIYKNGLEFELDCSPQSMMGWIDTDKIGKIIYNLLSNAAKFTKAPGKVNLKAWTNENFDRVTIEVTDTGIGIPAEHCDEHLFERFVKVNDFVPGTGPGLSICRSLAQSIDARVGMESKYGEGSQFWVELAIG
jgi:signal transduction histidine kinase